jgi:hypothetical protein
MSKSGFVTVCQQFLVFSLNQSCGSGFIYSGSGSSISSDPIRIQGFDDQKLKKKNTAEHFSSKFFIKNYSLLMSKLQEKPSALKKENPALQKIKFINFFYVCESFLLSWIRIAKPDPDTDPGTPMNPDPQHLPKQLQHRQLQ